MIFLLTVLFVTTIVLTISAIYWHRKAKELQTLYSETLKALGYAVKSKGDWKKKAIERDCDVRGLRIQVKDLLSKIETLNPDHI